MAEDGMELEEPSKETTQDLIAPAEPELPLEFEKLFKTCEENPEDFNGWVYLLQYVEQEVRLILSLKMKQMLTRLKWYSDIFAFAPLHRMSLLL